ncbi:polycomb complex protein BMI-1-A-like [Pomacea canaliculata]|uniref:polycomb complex protein BMI-1-A-like n=1 Tax=Pomacea canaliculata TaxID=400727 RepID=UPI000D73E1B0|nr:polycomb complex protein BMI-1-A-like [Pomacea canaliculata]
MNGASKRIKITDLNPNLICVLCGGYFIDATTLTECLHSFCKKCIVKYLETSKQCPVCDVLVHKTRPHLHIRSDKTLQDLVYKLVPGLYKNEMKRRRDFYSKHPEVAPKKVGEERGDEMAERIIYTEDEHFSLALHFSKRGVRDERSVRSLTLPEVVAVSKEPPKNVRYLRCPAGVTIGILKKFVRLKYELPNRYEIDIFHTDEALHEDYTLMDIAYIYTWRRKDPLRLNYSVYESKAKRPRLAIEPLANTPGLKPVKIEAGATLVKEEDWPSSKQDGARPLVKPDLKPACGQDKKPASKPEADNKEIKASEKPVTKTQEQQSEGGPPLVLQEDKKRQSTSTDEPAVLPSKQEPRIANLTPPSYVALDAATPKPASYSGPQCWWIKPRYVSAQLVR